MKPEAIKIAAAELLSQIEASPQPANEIINIYTRSRRYIGSKDRHILTDLVWSYIRHHMRLNFLYPDKTIPEKLDLLGECDKHDFPFAVAMETPDWLIPLIPNAEQELPALLSSAPIILRANGDRDKIQKQLSLEGIETTKTSLSPYGLILQKRANLQGSQSFKSGLIEIQDEGSQCVALETGIKASDKVLDYCAGAGGKSLIFAQMMNNKGQIVAHDISNKSLSELQKRATRAKATCITIQKQIVDRDFDHVVVDAPCSGTGTWRRCPDMRWKLTQEQLKNIIKTQADILNQACQYVRNGGHLSYMTCSLTSLENTNQIADFLKRHSNFTLIKEKQFSPALTGTDGLFIATLLKQEADS